MIMRSLGPLCNNTSPILQALSAAMQGALQNPSITMTPCAQALALTHSLTHTHTHTHTHSLSLSLCVCVPTHIFGHGLTQPLMKNSPGAAVRISSASGVPRNCTKSSRSSGRQLRYFHESGVPPLGVRITIWGVYYGR